MEAGTIATPRLTLLPLAPHHAEEMAEVLADRRLHEFIGGVPLSADRLRVRYERLAAGSGDAEVVWCNWVVRLESAGRLTGTVQATITGERAEVAWVVGTAWQGQGIAKEAAHGLVEWLRGKGVTTVVAHVHPEHAASAAVAAAVGLVATGERQDGEVRWQSDIR
ncbi:GNAT family N-acetyltransferase [Streptomyces sp. NRRL F-5123]|uniref:GNAT family N-acetyltransferase n=1 Tax=Streptomyces sp. NRRL F-5123 TaxID=1463856 RepID=UPI000AC893B2|nr:GNAT family N-acetyltransferase [Streptomyces sp. NRRL F-5123]